VFDVAAMCLRVASERCTYIGEFRVASTKSRRGEKTGKSRILRWEQLRIWSSGLAKWQVIPASFDISFLQHRLQYRRNARRRLLNIEKTVFYIAGIYSQQDPGPLGRVLVEVHPAGVISKHHASDHAFIIYNILCEEVLLGIPRQAWWVGFLAVCVICSAFYISGRLPETLVPAKLRAVKHPREAR